MAKKFDKDMDRQGVRVGVWLITIGLPLTLMVGWAIYGNTVLSSTQATIAVILLMTPLLSSGIYLWRLLNADKHSKMAHRLKHERKIAKKKAHKIDKQLGLSGGVDQQTVNKDTSTPENKDAK